MYYIKIISYRALKKKIHQNWLKKKRSCTSMNLSITDCTGSKTNRVISLYLVKDQI